MVGGEAREGGVMTFGSLFAGIGGMDLGLERAGMRCAWQVEIDPYARRVLEKHWPDVRRWDDVRTFPPKPTEDWNVDLVCGGFPCQDISFAGKGAGLAGERSGLWHEFARVVRVLRPRYVLVENVAALLVRGLDAVLGTLVAGGYDAEWACIPAAALGAPHIRERVFILAHSECVRFERHREINVSVDACEKQGRVRQSSGSSQALVYPNGKRLEGAELFGERLGIEPLPLHGGIANMAHSSGLDGLGDVPEPRREILLGMGSTKLPVRDGWWAVEPNVGRVAYGIPDRVDRLRCLGNAVVPQVAEWIGRQIMGA
jgi:DNA (cytosine-5)-methyltransferase 1